MARFDFNGKRVYPGDQARLVVNDTDFTAKLSGFTLKCNHCESRAVDLDIEWASYPSASWSTITVICRDCHECEVVHET